ncbi:MAG: glycogen/starch/alpha-glucan phosphorylase [Nitrospirae bacterium]|nr:glycogen/starch/alpha-glucan phosphorylase [Nitrospirota bacterium]MBF0541358.1 glycogen/starch/alpha-glucan phosphorylase [Nitrospirota bacterium]
MQAKNESESDVEYLRRAFIFHLTYSLSKDEYSAVDRDFYTSLAYAVRDRLTEKWINTQQSYYNNDVKRVYYLSLEFLMGRTLGNSIVNLKLTDGVGKMFSEVKHDVEEIIETEWDAGLGNGGLGRLAACFLDSMATLRIPAYGYGIRYEFGIFFQKIIDGAQHETPDNWLRLGNPWEFERPEFMYPVLYYGNVNQYVDANGRLQHDWVNTQEVMAAAYDTPVPGYNNETVNTLRLWSAKASREFDFQYFNDGDYAKAVSDKAQSETISKVLYPNDNIFEGQELRLKQEYFFVSATLQDIIRRYKKGHKDFTQFHKKVAIQLNDTHPAFAIPELMRIFVDIEKLDWDEAWDITTQTFAYTNHTVLPEALEKWSVSLIGMVLPRHLQIIYEINHRFIEYISDKFPGEISRLSRMSIIEEGDVKKVRMALLSIIGSHSVNGVSALHSEILKHEVFKDFFDIWPERFNNKTNGITPRRWLKLCNPGLSRLITENIGEGWEADLERLKKLIKVSKNKSFQNQWHQVKQENKQRLANYIKNNNGIDVNIDSIFDCHIKRIHEYKRQLLNVLQVIHRYNRIKCRDTKGMAPRTIMFAGKAAPGYYIAKLIIKLINSVAEVINNDKEVSDFLKVVFVANYSVSLAEKIIPAADLSEQISTAGTEASGTGNMKFALNGALTIGTLDGANIEIKDNVGDENIFIFGMNELEVSHLKHSDYNPLNYYNNNPELKQVLEMIANGYFSKHDQYLFMPLVDSLLIHGDKYMVLADFASYIECQKHVDKAFLDQDKWRRMSILNTANMGVFSSDRTIKEYADDIWGVKPV